MTLSIQQLSHTYPNASRPVLCVPDWRVERGEQILLRGVSGSGKTTLLNVVAGMLRPSEGEVVLDDTNLYALQEATRDRFRRAHIGYVFQNHYLLPQLSARENVEMPLAFAGERSARARRQRADLLLGELGLAEVADQRPGAMSTGQRLRVAVARALVNAPRLLLADEPTAALDGAAASTTVDLLQRTCRDGDATLILCSHDPALTKRFDSVFDLRSGELRIAIPS